MLTAGDRQGCVLLRAAEAAAFGGETEEGDGPAEGFPDGIAGELMLVSAVSRVELPEPAGRSLEDITADTPTASVQPLRVANEASAP